MTDKKPFDKEQSIKIPFSELVELINQKCDGKSVIAEGVMPKPVPYVLIVRCFSIRFRDQLPAKIQLFPNTQVSLRKITKNNVTMSKITIFVPLLMYRAISVPQQNNLEILKSTTIKQLNNKQSTI
ncbi:MAG: hypothetical protein IKO23_03910 [Bacteroidales bacterium]|nr:hypothetical protein [Bacteroidales bacterium]